MSLDSRSGNDVMIHGHVLSPPDFEVSWAGASGWEQPAICLGSEDGRVQFLMIDSLDASGPISISEEKAETYSISESGEAVNGVAFSSDLMAVSTRSDVTFVNVPRPGRGVPERIPERMTFHSGAHGIEATPSGYFVAPLGPSGLLIMGLGRSGHVQVIKSGMRDFNFYKVAPLFATDTGDVLACAARRDGLVILNLSQPHSGSGRVFRNPEFDIVDVCGLSSEAFPLAVAALGKDGSILLSCDVMEPHFLTLRPDEIQGTAYRILAAHGQIFVLTSKGLYTLHDLASHFLARQLSRGPIEVNWLKTCPVDVSLAYGRWLLIVGLSDVGLFDISSLVGSRQFGGMTCLESQKTEMFLEHMLTWEESREYELTSA